VDFYSTKKFPDWLKKDYLEAFEKTLNEDNLIEGSACRIFEKQFSTYLGTNYVLGVGNGFDALRLSLLALGIGRGDRVAVPAHTFIATWFAIQSVGAIPVGVYVTEDGQINLDLLEVQKDLKCVIPVHMHGTHCDMSRLTNWAKRNSVYVIEDCAQAAGLLIQGKKAGTWGDMGAFSFYPTKNLYALGDGGAITTNNIEMHRKIYEMHDHGRNFEGESVSWVRNSRLDNLQAAILNSKFDSFDKTIERRRESSFEGRLERLLRQGDSDGVHRWRDGTRAQ
jgi:dTDP-4-amino-4,6-dideoxygalactose transaminase